MQKTVRNSNFELLRILAMLFIVAHHFAFHGGFDQSSVDLINRSWLRLLENGGKIGVNIFVLISGYFLISVKEIKFYRYIKFWMQIFLFSGILFTVFYFVNGCPSITFEQVKTLFTPVSSSIWWFTRLYAILSLLFLFINKMAYSLSKKEYLILLCILSLLCLILPAFDIKYGLDMFIWFVYLYLIAGYIKIYDIKLKIKPVIGVIAFFLGYGFLTAFNLFLEIKYTDQAIIYWLYSITKIDVINNFFALILCLLLLLSFKKMKPHYSKIINFFSGGVFGVYLIHDYGSVREWLWGDLFKNATYQNTRLLIPYSIAAIFAVFLACLAISIFYNYTLGKLVEKIISFFTSKFCKKRGTNEE